MAPKKDLAALEAKEALAEKAAEKRKRPAQTVEERDHRCLRMGLSTPKAAPPTSAERVREGLPALPAMITLPFLLRFIGEGFGCQPKAARERIRGTLLHENMRVFEQADPEGLIGWSLRLFRFCK